MIDSPSQEDIFFAALERRTAADRSTFLDEACAADAGLRLRVDRLLAAHPRVGGFLEQPVQELADVGPTTTAAAVLDILAPARRPEALGRLGHHEVLQVLGCGGTGV